MDAALSAGIQSSRASHRQRHQGLEAEALLESSDGLPEYVLAIRRSTHPLRGTLKPEKLMPSQDHEKGKPYDETLEPLEEGEESELIPEPAEDEDFDLAALTQTNLPG